MPATPDLQCIELTKDFSDFRAVDQVSFDVPPGSFFSILGPSGCGKTTLLRMIAGFQFPTSGDLKIKGKSMIGVGPNKRPVSMVFQHLALFPMMNIGENVGFGLRQRGVNKTEIKQRVERVLDRVGLPGITERQVSQLSGGQKQRVAIARCMVLEPDVLLLDEPLGALDLKLREHMKIELKSLQSAFNTTFVYITHDQSEALVMSDKIAVMNKGRFDQIGTARELYYDPNSAFVAGFVGDANRFEGKITAVNGDAVTMITDNGSHLKARTITERVTEGQHVQIFIRPEAIQLTLEAVADADEYMIESVLFNGANSLAILRDPATGDLLNVTLPQTGAFLVLGKGDRVHARWDPQQARCYPGEGR
ncbi:ABC transporter ATP-binding protein [Pontivivens nitratireducens]|uniref:ABC transporter ATP-binding protein n=1 Tax=Pontivivens nitratireducens TaxID=2758038 RepID=A0A6G7VKX5_9RHOB|nr:ABC transporter ATP-binding protein [Pontibrevibacter nitratireducens]QIK40516.1 ABC transporter ATP-binding protein [Pontibrevibacter nitratireducens]